MAEQPENNGRGGGKDDGLSPVAQQLRTAQPYIDAVWKLVGGPAAGALVGFFLDRWLGTTPWLLVGLSVTGIVVGFYAFIRAMGRMGKKP